MNGPHGETGATRQGASVQEPSVVVTHSGRAYAANAAAAAFESGLLKAFVTGVTFSGNKRWRLLIRWAAARWPASLLRSVGGRTYPSLPAELIVSFPTAPLVGRFLRELPSGRSLEDRAISLWGRQVGRWLRAQRRPRVVHAFEGQALEVFRAAKEVDATTILDVNNAFEFAAEELAAEGLPTPSRRLLRRISAERELADYLLAPSEFVARCLVENGIPRERVLLLPLASAVVDDRHVDDSPRAFRAFFCGHLGARKGLRYLLDAWVEADLEPGSELLLVGGTDSLGRRLLKDLPDGVRAPGYVPWPSLQEWFSTSDVFVFPSLAEGSALVIYQAMATGLPVITTPNAGSVVRNGVDGFIIPPRDVHALAEKLRVLANDPELRARLGESAAVRIRSGFTWSHYAVRIEAIYRSVLGGEVPEGLPW